MKFIGVPLRRPGFNELTAAAVMGSGLWVLAVGLAHVTRMDLTKGDAGALLHAAAASSAISTPETSSAVTLIGASTLTSQLETWYGSANAVDSATSQPAASASSTLSSRGIACRLSRKLRAKNRPNTAARHMPAGGATLFHHCCSGQAYW